WIPHSGAILEQVLRLEAKIAMPTVMADVGLLREVGGFDEKLRFAEDYDLWARLSLRSGVSCESRQLADVRTHGEQFSVGATAEHESWPMSWASLYAKMEDLVPTRRLRW